MEALIGALITGVILTGRHRDELWPDRPRPRPSTWKDDLLCYAIMFPCIAVFWGLLAWLHHLDAQGGF